MVVGDLDFATTLLVGLLTLVVLQRLAELRLARHNERWALSQGAREYGRRHYPLFFLLHGGWLLGWALESFQGSVELASTWVLWLAVFVLAVGIRYWAISTLGSRWNTRILVVDGLPPVRRGPYRMLAHPNYLAVALELFALPALFGAWLTAVVASVLNAALLLGVRIPAEERALQLAAARRS